MEEPPEVLSWTESVAVEQGKPLHSPEPASSEISEEERRANLAWLLLQTVPTRFQFCEAVSCLTRIVEVLPQPEQEAAAMFERALPSTNLPALLYREQLVDHLLNMVLEAGDAHASRQAPHPGRLNR